MNLQAPLGKAAALTRAVSCSLCTNLCNHHCMRTYGARQIALRGASLFNFDLQLPHLPRLVAAGCGRTISLYSLSSEIVYAVVRGITHGQCRSCFQDLNFSKNWAATKLDARSCPLSSSRLLSRHPPIGILTGCKFRVAPRSLLVKGNWPLQSLNKRVRCHSARENKQRSLD